MLPLNVQCSEIIGYIRPTIQLPLHKLTKYEKMLQITSTSSPNMKFSNNHLTIFSFSATYSSITHPLSNSFLKGN